MTRQEQIDRLAEWWGLHRRPSANRKREQWWVNDLDIVCARSNWDPFASLDDARLLLLECERRVITWQVVAHLGPKDSYGSDDGYLHGIRNALLLTSKQITKAVQVVAGLEVSSGKQVTPN